MLPPVFGKWTSMFLRFRRWVGASGSSAPLRRQQQSPGGANGGLYVNFNVTRADAFDRVVLLGSTPAFEADDLAFNAAALIPEAASVVLLGARLPGLGLVRRRGRGTGAA